jgi:hypothetical protein
LFNPFRYAVLVSLVAVLLPLVLPIGILVYSIVDNPECLVVKTITEEEYVGNNTYRVPVVIKYCSMVPLTNFKVVFNSTTIEIPRITRGDYRYVVYLEPGDRLLELEFRIMGLYRVRIKFGVST